MILISNKDIFSQSDDLKRLSAPHIKGIRWVHPDMFYASQSFICLYFNHWSLIYYLLFPHQVGLWPFKHVKHKKLHYSARFKKSWPPFCQIWSFLLTCGWEFQLNNWQLTLWSLNLPLSFSSTTSRELLSQFSTCSGWSLFDVVSKLKKIAMNC